LGHVIQEILKPWGIEEEYIDQEESRQRQEKYEEVDDQNSKRQEKAVRHAHDTLRKLNTTKVTAL
jgi:hypothetical protein